MPQTIRTVHLLTSIAFATYLDTAKVPRIDWTPPDLFTAASVIFHLDLFPAASVSSTCAEACCGVTEYKFTLAIIAWVDWDTFCLLLKLFHGSSRG